MEVQAELIRICRFFVRRLMFHTLVTSLENVLHYVLHVVHLKGQILIICIFLEEEKRKKMKNL